MPITINCPSCLKQFRARDESAGKKVKCPKCLFAVDVPTPAPPSPASEGTPVPAPSFAPPAPVPARRPVPSSDPELPELPPLPAPAPAPRAATPAPVPAAPKSVPVPERKPSAPAKSALPEARCLIFGPASCGKTSLLSTLKIAADQLRPDKKTNYNVLPQDKLTLEFFVALSAAILQTGRINFAGTPRVVEHRFSLEQVTEGWLRTNRTTYDFYSTDSPGATGLPMVGGAELVDPDQRAAIIAKARQSEALILLVDVADPKAMATFHVSLLPFLADVALNGRLNFRRVAIVLTKADTLVARHGAGARAELGNADPWQYAIDSAIGRMPIRQLLQYLRPEHRRSVYCGWASVYGFIPEDGAVNVIADADGDRLAVYDPHETSWVNRWHPYQVLDPFVYIATGSPMGLKPLPPELTKGL